MLDDKDKALAELSSRDKCADKPIHSAWPSRFQSIGQWPRVRCTSCAVLDPRLRGADRLMEQGSPWETDYAKASTGRCVMNCSTAKPAKA